MARPLADIRAVTFDIDDTLWDLSAALDQAHVDAIDELHRMAPTDAARAITVADMAAAREVVAAEMAAARSERAATWLEDVRRASMHRLVDGLELNDPTAVGERLAEVFFETRFGNVRLYDDARSTLESLHGRYQLGLVTNGNTSLAATPVHPWFECNVTAAGHGCTKPDSRLFTTAARELGCDPQHVLHVGDSLPEDVAGAQAAGMIGVWLNRSGRPNDTDVVPDLEIRGLDELPALLGCA